MNHIKKVHAFAKKYFTGFDSAHGIKHAETTANFAKILAEKENADSESCIIAALLHDIGRSKEKTTWRKETIAENHGVTGSFKAKQFLLSINMNNTKIREICEAISQHCFPRIQTTTISKILWDSDKLNMFSKEMEEYYLKLMTKEQILKERKFYLGTFHTTAARQITEQTL